MSAKWKSNKLGNICEIARGGSPRPIKSYLTTDSDGVNWIKIGDAEVGGKYIDSTKEKIKKSGVKFSRYVEEGDFLLSNSMSFGRPYILRTNGCIHDGWLVLKGYQDTFTQDFLYYLLSSPSVMYQFEDAARGSTVRNLNTDIVSNVIVPIPPFEEQERLVQIFEEEFSKIEVVIKNTENTLTLCKDLKQAILRAGFLGNL